MTDTDAREKKQQAKDGEATTKPTGDDLDIHDGYDGVPFQEEEGRR